MDKPINSTFFTLFLVVLSACAYPLSLQAAPAASTSTCPSPPPWFRRIDNRSTPAPGSPTTTTPSPADDTPTPTPLSPTTSSPTEPPPAVCANSSLDPTTGCQCPLGTVPADNGCCKAQCEVQGECLVDIKPERGLAQSYPTPDSCGDQVCDYVWGDPHVVQKDFRWDPMWYGWMLLTQCDGLKVFSNGRQYQATSSALTCQDRILFMYRSTIVEVIHEDWERGWGNAYLTVKGMDAALANAEAASSSSSLSQLQMIPLSDQMPSVQIGEGGAQVTVTRLKETIIQVCTASGDTFKISMRNSIALDVWFCLAPTCNFRATGFLGIHGAPKDQRYTLPGETDSKGELPYNRSPYQKLYMSAWYNETDKQLAGLFPKSHPPFPRASDTSSTCDFSNRDGNGQSGRDRSSGSGGTSATTTTVAPTSGGTTPAPSPPSGGGDTNCTCGTRRYCACRIPSGTNYTMVSPAYADSFCRRLSPRAGFAATIANASDQSEAFASFQAQGIKFYTYDRLVTGGSDVDQEGLFVWKYGPPYNRGKNISIGYAVRNNLECLQDDCFWRKNHPGWGQANNNQLVLEPTDNFAWSDHHYATAILCEFPDHSDVVVVTTTTTVAPTTPPTPAPSSTTTKEKQEEQAILRALETGGGVAVPPSQKTQELRANGLEDKGPNCTEIIDECRAANCPETIFSENPNPGDQCAIALEWLVATEYNEKLPPDSPDKIPTENITTMEDWENIEPPSNNGSSSGSIGCPPGQYYCATCGDHCSPKCFSCPPDTTTSSCLGEGGELIVDTQLGSCRCTGRGGGISKTATLTLSLTPTLTPDEENLSAPQDDSTQLLGLWIGLGILLLLLCLIGVGCAARRLGHKDEGRAGYRDNTKYTKGFEINANPDECELEIPALLKDNGGDGDPMQGKYGAPTRGRGKIPIEDPSSHKLDLDLDEAPLSAPDAPDEEEDLLGGPKVFFDKLGEPISSCNPKESRVTAEGKWRQGQKVGKSGELLSTESPEVAETKVEGTVDETEKRRLHDDLQNRLLSDAARNKDGGNQPQGGAEPREDLL